MDKTTQASQRRKFFVDNATMGFIGHCSRCPTTGNRKGWRKTVYGLTCLKCQAEMAAKRAAKAAAQEIPA